MTKRLEPQQGTELGMSGLLLPALDRVHRA
jgi:hypothetical protein